MCDRDANQAEPITFNRNDVSCFSIMEPELHRKQGCIWRTRSLDEGYPAVHVFSDQPLLTECGGSRQTLHSSFDAALLLDKGSGPESSFLDFQNFGCTGDNNSLNDLAGKKHLRQRPALERLKTHCNGAIRKQARLAADSCGSCHNSGKSRLRLKGPTKKPTGISNPSPALKRRRALSYQKESPMQPLTPTRDSVSLHAQLLQGQDFPQKQIFSSIDPTEASKRLTPSHPSISANRTATKRSNSETTSTTDLLETTLESDNAENSPTTTRFRFTSFPESLPRVSNPRSRQCPDPICRRMSFNEIDGKCIGRSRDDECTQDTSISSFSVDGCHHSLPPQINQPDLLEPRTDNTAFSSRCRSNIFECGKNFGVGDEDNLESSLPCDVGRTRLNFNCLLTPTLHGNSSPGGCAVKNASSSALAMPYDHRRINRFGSFVSSTSESLTPARSLPAEEEATPDEIQLHFPPETECSPIPRGYENTEFDTAADTGASKPFLSSKCKTFSNDSSEENQKDEESTASDSIISRLPRLRPMPDMSAFEASSRADRSGDDSKALDSRGVLSANRPLCPPTPIRTPAWASEGKPNGCLWSRQNSLISTKVLLACPSQVLEGRNSLENSLLDDEDQECRKVSQSETAGRTCVPFQENFPGIVSSAGKRVSNDCGDSSSGSSTSSQLIVPPPRSSNVSVLPVEQEVGSVISFSEDFKVLRLLGSGTFADAYKVRFNRDGRLYAVKRNRRQFRGKRDRNMALAEVQHMQRLQNTCIEPGKSAEKMSYSLYLLFFYRAWQEDGYFFCQTELCCRDTCRELLDSLRVYWSSSRKKYPSLSRNLPASTGNAGGADWTTSARSLPNTTVLKICHDISAGLCHIHSHQLVHNDIKPSNIFFVLNSRFGAMCKIGDFGMAGSVGSSGDGQEGDTRYMPPELLSSIARHPSADIFSLGLTLYEAATDHHIDMPSEGPLWHELRNSSSRKLPAWRDHEFTQLIKAMLDPCEQRRPTAEEILNCGLVVSAGHARDTFLQDYLLDVEDYDKFEAESFALTRHDDRTPKTASNRHDYGVARSPSLSLLSPAAIQRNVN
eukprot:scaffold3036_cov117-Cylindrotheca_fusiformis.AAC.4